MFKKLFTMVLVSVLAFTCITPSTAYAHETQVPEPYVVTACPSGNGIHQMARRGNGTVFVNGRTELADAPCWQCKNCYTVIVTQNDPTISGQIIGKYATMSCSYEISAIGAFVYANSVNYCGSRTMEGYRFYYQF